MQACSTKICSISHRSTEACWWATERQSSTVGSLAPSLDTSLDGSLVRRMKPCSTEVCSRNSSPEAPPVLGARKHIMPWQAARTMARPPLHSAARTLPGLRRRTRSAKKKQQHAHGNSQQHTIQPWSTQKNGQQGFHSLCTHHTRTRPSAQWRAESSAITPSETASRISMETPEGLRPQIGPRHLLRIIPAPRRGTHSTQVKRTQP